MVAEYGFRGFIAALNEVDIDFISYEERQRIMDAANELSCKRLRASQMLAFSLALHYRLGDDCIVRDDLEDMDICMLLSLHVYAQEGHGMLCSRLGEDYPWYEVKVRYSFRGFGATSSLARANDGFQRFLRFGNAGM